MTTPDPSAPESQPIVLPLEPATPAAEADQPKPRKRRRAAILVSSGLALLLVLGGVAYAGYQFLVGGAQPAERMPASVIAYASLDLKPGLDQQKKLQSLVRKFPKAGTNADSAEQVVDDLLKKLDLDDVDVQKDLASWVGVRASAGLWLHKDQAYLLTAVATKDDKAASEALNRIVSKVTTSSVGFVVEDGVALIATGDKDGLEAAKAAVAEAKEHPLTESDRFAQAQQWLGDDHVGAIWIDLTRVSDLAKTVTGSLKEQLAMVKALQETAPQMKGTFVFGVRATDFGVEAHYRTFGYDNKEKGLADAVAKLGAQPASSDVAALISMPDLKNNPAVAKALEGMGMGTETNSKPLTKAERDELTVLMGKETLTAAQEKRADELMMRMGGAANPMAIVRPIINALSGATLIASGGDLRADPAFAISAQVATAADAKVLGDLQSILGATGGGPTVTVDGTTVTVASPGYSKAGDTLAGNSDFTTATGGAPQQAQMALYVNLSALMTVKERDEAGPVKAVGVVSGYEGSELAGSIRVLVG